MVVTIFLYLFCTWMIPNGWFPVNMQVRTLHPGIGVMHDQNLVAHSIPFYCRGESQPPMCSWARATQMDDSCYLSTFTPTTDISHIAIA